MSNTTVHNGLFVDYCAKDFLDGTQQLGPWEELAYRRIIDLIYASNDRLADDDKKLAWMTKTGTRWPKIKHALVEVYGKLEVIDGRLTNRRCREQLAKTAKKIEQKREAGRASAASRNPMENNETGSTAVATDVPTSVPTNHVPTNLFNKNPESNPPPSKHMESTAAKAAVGFVGMSFKMSAEEVAHFGKVYFEIPDFVTALKSLDQQLRGKTNVHQHLHAKLLGKHEYYRKQKQKETRAAVHPPRGNRPAAERRGRNFKTARQTFAAKADVS